MMKFYMALLISMGILLEATASEIKLETDYFRLAVNPDGILKEMTDIRSGTNYLRPKPVSYLAQIRMYGEKNKVPVKNITVLPGASSGLKVLSLTFKNNVQAQIEVKTTPLYLTLEVKSLSDSNVQYFFWGPYYTTIDKTVGGCVGVVRNGDYAICMRTMELNTAGGVDESNVRGGGLQDNTTAARIKDLGKKSPVKGPGSRLAAYSKDRSRHFQINVGSYKKVEAFPVKGETPTGSKIVFFGCPDKAPLSILEKMVKAEGLPYPTWHGVWSKLSKDAVRPCLIIPFSEKNIDKCIEIAKAGSFAILHEKIPYESKGTFRLRKDLFPNGYKGLQMCEEKAKAAGLELSLHNLSTFIDWSDPYSRGIPNKHLAISAMTKLSGDISAGDKTIIINAGDVKDGYIETESKPARSKKTVSKVVGIKTESKPARSKKTVSKVVRIEDELVLYKNAEADGEKIKLLNCKRGFNKTEAVAHKKGAPIGRMLLHKRGDFYPDMVLLPEIAKNLAASLDKTGVKSLSFDGLEGTDTTGHAQFALAVFTKTVWDSLKNKELLSSSSRYGDYYWYLNSHQSWGEPHAKGFRHEKKYYEIKIPSRIFNLRKNYIPYRLGQYQFSKLSSITDIEWLMTKCAGLGGGFDLYVTPEDYERSGKFGKQVMETISLWEKAREKEIFTPEQREDMIKYDTVYRLTKDSTGKFTVKKLSEEEAKEVVNPVLGQKRKNKKDAELYH